MSGSGFEPLRPHAHRRRILNEHAVLIFDLDGTLFHTETVIVPAVREAFALHGLAPPPDDEICSLIGRTWAEYEPWLHGLA